MNKLINSVPIRVKNPKSKNRGKIAGYLHFREDEKPYYYTERSWTQGTMMTKPQFQGYCFISQDIVMDLSKRGIEKCVFRFSGFDKHTFFIVIPLSEFLSGRTMNFDDPQKMCRWDNKIRHPEFPNVKWSDYEK